MAVHIDDTKQDISSDQFALEVEIATEAVASLDDTVECDKNPGHRQFLPFNRFQESHIPSSYRSNTLYRFLKNVGDSVVRLTVTCEDGSMRFGSGVVMKYRGQLYIYTNNHVIETDFQAKHCDIDFDYNHSNCFTMKHSRGTALLHTFSNMDKSMITFDPVPDAFDHSYMPDSGRCRAIIKTTVGDKECEFRGLACVRNERYCVVLKNTSEFKWTQDRVRASTLYFREFDNGDKIHATCSRIWESNGDQIFLELDPVPDMIRGELEKEEHFWIFEQNLPTLPIVIAHPHGGPKMVTIGKKIEVEYKDSEGVVLHHSAPTCGGSSGGAVIAVGDDNKVRGLYQYLYLHCLGCRSTKYLSQTGSDNLNTSSLSIWL